MPCNENRCLFISELIKIQANYAKRIGSRWALCRGFPRVYNDEILCELIADYANGSGLQAGSILVLSHCVQLFSTFADEIKSFFKLFTQKPVARFFEVICYALKLRTTRCFLRDLRVAFSQ